MRSLPTVALTADHVPEADAPARAIIAFAQSLDGYTEAGSPAEIKSWMDRVDADGPHALDLNSLRIALFGFQRAHYGQGGGWPDGDPVMDRMREITAAIREKVAEAPRLGVWLGDITQLQVSAVVNAANERMLGGGGVDGAIHQAAGPELREACERVPQVRPGVRCPAGEARVTLGFRLPARLVIHTVGPIWRGGGHGEDDLLASAYRSSLALAEVEEVASVAFPAISTGVYGFPPNRAARIAVDTVHQWLAEHDRPQRVVLVAFDADSQQTLNAALAERGD